MKRFLIKYLTYIVALAIVPYIIPGVTIDSLHIVLAAALVLAMVNTFVKPVILTATLPLNVMSMGLFALVINGMSFYLVAHFMNGFNVSDFMSAFWAAILFGIMSFVLKLFFMINFGIRFGSANNTGRSSVRPEEVDKDVYDLPESDWRTL